MKYDKILETLFKKYGDFWICLFDEEKYKSSLGWSKWIKFSENKNKLEEDSKIYRSILTEEIVLDLESKKFEDIKNNLINLKLNFKIFDSGGKGTHFHLFFEDIKKYDESIRPYIKKYIINKLGFSFCDEKKSDNKNLIGLEFSKHRNGNKKELIFETDEDFYKNNELTEDMKEYIKTLPEKYVGTVSEDISPTVIFEDKEPCDAIKKLIESGQEHPNRNPSANFIVQILRDYCGKNFDEIFEILKIYNKNCKPIKNEEIIKRDLIEQYKRKYTLNCKSLSKICPFTEKQLCPKYHILKEQIVIGNEEIVKNMNIKQIWDEYWRENMIGQEIWRDLLFSSLVGIVLDEQEEDFRINITFSSYTSTGKDLGVNLLISILNDSRLNVKSCKPTEVTDKFLVGGIDDKAREFNIKHNLSPGKTKLYRNEEIEGKDEIVFGAFSQNKLIAFTEAEVVFSPSTFNKRIQLNLRRVMDEERRPYKGVGNQEITYFCNPTIILTSYPIPKIIRLLLTNGLFQRTFFYDAEITDELDKKIVDFQIRKLFDIKSKMKTSIYKDELINKLLELKDWYYKNKEDFLKEINENYSRLSNIIMKEIDKIKESYDFLDKEDKKILDAILRRGIKNIRKLIIINSLCNDKKISEKNIKESINLFTSCLDSVKELIWTSLKSDSNRMLLDKYETAVINILKKNKNKISLSKLYDEMEKKLKITSVTTKDKWLDRIEARGIVKRIWEGQSKFVIKNEETD